MASTACVSGASQAGHSSASAGAFSPQFGHITFKGRLQEGQRSSAVPSTSAPQFGQVVCIARHRLRETRRSNEEAEERLRNAGRLLVSFALDRDAHCCLLPTRHLLDGLDAEAAADAAPDRHR